MNADWRPKDVRLEIERLCHSGLDPETLRTLVVGQLSRAIPFDAWCWTTAEPATGLITGVDGRNLPSDKTQRFLEIEYTEPDFTKFADLAHRRVPVDFLSRATEGHLEHSIRYREIFGPAGIGEDLRAALTVDGSTWGYLGLHRNQAQPFDAYAAGYLGQLTRTLALAVRTALLLGSVEDQDDESGPGVLLLDDEMHVHSASAAARHWMGEILARRSSKGGQIHAGGIEKDGLLLPDAVGAVVARLVQLERDDADAPQMPRVRVPSSSGRWLTIHATRLAATDVTSGSSRGAIAVIIEPTSRHDLMPLLLDAYALSSRESDVTRLVLLGKPTKRIAEELEISPLTVQQHLKGIFDKVGVRSKRDLAATIFATHYWPRVASGATLAADGSFES